MAQTPKRVLSPSVLKRTLQCFCVDLSGTIHIEKDLIPGVIEGIKSLRRTKSTIRFVTNTSQFCKTHIVEELQEAGLEIHHNEVYTSLSCTRDIITSDGLRPLYLLSESAKTDFVVPTTDEDVKLNAVVVGLSSENFNFDKLNEALEILLLPKARLLAVNKGRYFKVSNGLRIGAGAVVKALEYASEKPAEVIGKPNPTFFTNVLNSVCCRPANAIMIGDDVKDDIIGALNAGMNACLVKTGKYCKNDEHTVFIPQGETMPVRVVDRALVVDSFAEAIKLLT